VTVTSQGDPTISDSVTDTTTVGAKPDVSLTPDNTRSANPGEMMTYTHQLRNTGNTTDTFNLAYASSQGYTVTLYVNGVITTAVPNVAPGDYITITAVVQVPPLALANTLDTVAITATSTLDPDVSDVAYDFTSINPLTGGTITPDPLELPVEPGTTLYFVQNWRNLANHEDRGNISVYDIPPGWDVHIMREATPATPNATGIYTNVTGLTTTNWITVATESNGDGVLDDRDTVNATADTGSDGIPDSGQLGISGTLTSTTQVILVVTVSSTETVGVYTLIERGSSHRDWQDNHATLAYNNDAVYHDDAFKIARVMAPDHDGDGIPDHIDLDDDNDGIPDVQECPGGTCPDTDGDNIPDYFDLDSDNDGIPDITEAGGGDYDTDKDGVIDSTEDVDNDGLMDVIDPDPTGPSGGTLLPVPDTDNDTHPDYVDLDADDDGIPDNIESQPTVGYRPPSGNDNDNDGLDDTYDPDSGGTPVPVTNTDGTDQPDYLDLDADNDDISDEEESDRGTPTGVDSDGDGLDDGFDDNVGTPVPNDGITDPSDSPELPDSDGDVNSGGDVDYRDYFKTGTVTGTVFEDINGDGTYNPGELGLAGVTVSLVGPGPDGVFSSADDVVYTTTTTTDGSYTFDDIPVGAYRVKEIDPDGYVSTSSNNVPISIPPDGTVSANFGDQKMGTVSGSVFEDLNGNGKQDPGELGIGGVEVTLVNPGDDGLFGTGDDDRTVTTTSPSGVYVFEGVLPGSYQVVETDPDGYVSTSSNTAPVSVGSGGAASANFGDQRVGTVSGSVFSDFDGDGNQDPGETGLVSVTVTLVAPGPDGIFGTGDDVVISTTTTSDEGRYAFDGVAPGSYQVVETDPSGYVSTSSNHVPVTLGSGGAASANFGDQKMGTISGVVFNDLNGNGIQEPGEAGLVGVDVTLVAPGADGMLGTADDQLTTTQTISNGVYIFEDVMAGPYVIQESDPTGFTSTTNNTIPTSVAPGGATTVNFGDQATSTVSGKVFSDSDGNGVQGSNESGVGGVVVSLVDPFTGQVVVTTTTTGDGVYLFSDVPPGAYLVEEVNPDGFVSTTPDSVSVSVASGSAETANFGDQQVGTVSGVVFDDLNGDGIQGPNESGLGGVVVSLVVSETGQTITVTTTSNGRYIFDSVPPGTYIVQEQDPDGFASTTDNETTITITAGGAATANFGDQAIGTVSGVVFNDMNGNGIQDVGENSLSGVTVELLDASGQVITSVVTVGDGSYAFTGVPSGDYTVREVDPDGFVSITDNEVPVMIATGGAATANFGDQLTATVSGAVYNDVDGDGIRDWGEEGIGGVTVSLHNVSSGEIFTVTTAGDGSYIFIGITPGIYEVVEIDPDRFTSTTPNTVEVTVPSGGSSVASFGDWLVLLCHTPADDYERDNFYSDATEVDTDGTVVSRTFHVVNDKDWVKFYAWADRVYTITTSHLDADVDTILQLYAEDGVTLLKENDDYALGSDASRIVWPALADGWYYARVTHFDHTYEPLYSEVCGNHYLVAVVAGPCNIVSDAYEPDDVYPDAQPIATDGTVVTRSFEVVADKDWVKFDALAGQVYTITTSHLGAAMDTVIQLYDTDGKTLLLENDDYIADNEASRIVWQAPQGGTYFVRVTHFDPTYDPRTSPVCGNYYRIAVESPLCTPVDDYEPDSLYTAAAKISTDGDVYTRAFNTVADKDWVKFNAQAGQAYTITTSHLDVDVDTVLQLYDVDGETLLYENDDYMAGSEASRIIWTAPKDGIYFVRVTHFDHTYDPRYALVCGSQYGVSIFQDVLGIEKWAANLTSKNEIRPGGIISYTLAVWNKLDDIQTRIIITDPIPRYTSYVSGSVRTTRGLILAEPAPMITMSGGADVLVVGVHALEAHGRVTITFQVQVSEYAVGKTIVNKAEALSDQQGKRAYTQSVVAKVYYYTYLPIVTKKFR
jgi:uncharacterized repeat protein (TIGR01451 family)